MNECHRILKPGGKMQIIVPNWKAERAYGDMTHEWPPVTAMFFNYLHKGWREANKLTYGAYAGITCDFDWQAGPTDVSSAFSMRSYDAQMFALRHYMEAHNDMWANLIKRG